MESAGVKVLSLHFQGEATLPKLFMSPSKKGSTLQGKKICSSRKKDILFLESRPRESEQYRVDSSRENKFFPYRLNPFL